MQVEIISIPKSEFQSMMRAFAEEVAAKVEERMRDGATQGLITIEEAAVRYDKPLATLREYKWRHDSGRGKGIRSHKVGRTVYIKPEELEEDLLNMVKK